MKEKQIDVIICTHQPNLPVLNLVLDGLAEQSLDRNFWNLWFIVNESSENTELVQHVEYLYADLEPNFVHEPKLGLVNARIAAMKRASSDLIVFSDDDTVLAPNYLENALAIAEQEPNLGAYGGRSIGVYSTPPPKWFLDLSAHIAVRDYGDSEITSSEDAWGHWEPIGAGFVVRRIVWERFCEFCEAHASALGLGRNGTNLMAGEDSLLARMACRVGFSCGYRPLLRLNHHIPNSRMKVTYMSRVIKGHGASYYHLEDLLTAAKPFDLPRLYIAKTCARRFFKEGLSGFVRTFWEIGYRRERLKFANKANHEN